MNVAKIANTAGTVVSVLITLLIIWNCVTTGNWVGGIFAWVLLVAANVGIRSAIARNVRTKAEVAAYRAFKAEMGE